MNKRPFCRENMEYILNDEFYVEKMYDIIKTGTIQVFLKFIDWKYFNEQHPENHVIRYHNSDEERKLDIFNGKEWICKDAIDAITDMFHRLGDDIDNFLGYMESISKKVDTKKFLKNIARPMQLDMVYIEVEESEPYEIEDEKNKIIKQVFEYIKKKSSPAKSKKSLSHQQKSKKSTISPPKSSQTCKITHFTI